MIKTLLRDSVRRVLLPLARMKLRSMPIPTTKRAAIVPPAVPGSVGDAAMISATIHALRKRGFDKVDLLFSDAWPLDEVVDTKIASTAFFYKGSPTQQARLIMRLGDYSHVYFIGADVIDGAYNPKSVCRRISLLREASAAGRTAAILGASYNHNPDEATQRALTEAPKTVVICARDPFSRERLERATGRSIRQVADLAFLLQPRPRHPTAREAIAWISKRKEANERVVAININYLQMAKYPALKAAYRAVADRLLDEGVSLLLVPHDSRTPAPDIFHLRELTQGMKKHQSARTFLLETDSPGAVKAALAEVDLLLTGRLHAMILAMGSGTPALGIVYQGKFEGVLKLFQLSSEKMTVEPDDFIDSPGSVADTVLSMVENSDALRATILDRIPAVLALSEQNFA